MKQYKAIYEDDEMEVFSANNDDEAKIEAWEMESEHGVLFDLHEIDEDYNEVKSII